MEQPSRPPIDTMKPSQMAAPDDFQPMRYKDIPSHNHEVLALRDHYSPNVHMLYNIPTDGKAYYLVRPLPKLEGSPDVKTCFLDSKGAEVKEEEMRKLNSRETPDQQKTTVMGRLATQKMWEGVKEGMMRAGESAMDDSERDAGGPSTPAVAGPKFNLTIDRDRNLTYEEVGGTARSGERGDTEKKEQRPDLASQRTDSSTAL